MSGQRKKEFLSPHNSKIELIGLIWSIRGQGSSKKAKKCFFRSNWDCWNACVILLRGWLRGTPANEADMIPAAWAKKHDSLKERTLDDVMTYGGGQVQLGGNPWHQSPCSGSKSSVSSLINPSHSCLCHQDSDSSLCLTSRKEMIMWWPYPTSS